ncbi:MAG: hypothetical protein A2287_10175 [Candidatus Melainabacteria bacterium RIFOXYA12_FULL_32_12]|nr:MAG: hypothetical protein A2255_02330 [Candidatus Melainabacteria bacterium RIFOXYA2_FULL_32_9]OGI25486.1 MAG: hypothetical protein A2287_10175 [Candidatus Melainabacteria bacterium RIFOXYA12_FULL_32_12]
MMKTVSNSLVPTFKGIYKEEIPNDVKQEEIKQTYGSATASDLDNFKKELKEIAEKQVPKKDTVTLHLFKTDDSDLEPLGVCVTYKTPKLAEGISERDIPEGEDDPIDDGPENLYRNKEEGKVVRFTAALNGLSEILSNKNLVLETIQKLIKQSKDAGSEM